MPGPRVLALLLLAAAAHAQEASIRSRDPVAWWPLDEVAEQGSSDRASRVRDRLEGNYRLVDGVVGKAESSPIREPIGADACGVRRIESHLGQGRDLVAQVLHRPLGLERRYRRGCALAVHDHGAVFGDAAGERI